MGWPTHLPLVRGGGVSELIGLINQFFDSILIQFLDQFGFFAHP